ncbi:WD repeat-containing protein 6 [Nymphalis io]|uniref:WD repeat-containing protein 6 n=1 Tax=Inachis io TaxID=171585 RepID=UPI002168838D|nr:WD repeat-containing protein 6 [Nymphalis io]XP_050348247.1 WD repeat-containing protein 6 [Nymphalis io]XP_050348248.1 WD repeat-containing protein 6 [Nymphalis io]
MSLLTRTDVTTVKFFNNFVLAGVGSSLEVFNKESGKFIQKIKIFNGQKVHSVEYLKCESKFLIIGGKQFSIIELIFNCDEDAVSEQQIVCSILCNDWLHSGTWISKEEVAVLTAHNVVQIWNIKDGTFVKEYISKDNSILYSGLVFPLLDDILVFSGTVFSDVIIHRCGDDAPLHHLKGHKGVIFSITYNSEKAIIVTTSDDRSVRIWSICNTEPVSYETRSYWNNANITCVHTLYGHMARVMRSLITNDLIISIGEDSRICFWNHQGKLLRKILSHQNSCIWSLDADDEHLVTGGGDCGVILHPLSLVSEYGHKEIIPIKIDTPKKVKLTARQNIIIMNESNELIYYDVSSNTSQTYDLCHTSTYKLLSISSCKQIIAVADMNGKLDVFIENCKGDAVIHKIIDTQLNLGKILSLHWAGNRHIVVCSENGLITVLASKEIDTETVDVFQLPPCKERWLTSSALSSNRDVLVVGDRCGHIHVYVRGNRNPVKSFDRIYDRYGATSITIRNNEIITTGRDGKIKYFSLNSYDNQIKYMCSKDVEFQWLEKFLDKNENYLCGFQERVFVVYDVKNNIKVLEVACGGGHRSWDAVRYIEKINGNFEEFIRILYLKNYTLHSETFQLSKIMSKNIINGIHSKQINCLKTYKYDEENTLSIFISGGEDTTLRVSSSDQKTKLKDELIFKQLSSIRTLKFHRLDKNKILLISAGGRAQICAKILTFDRDNIKVTSEELVDYLIKGTDKERKGDKNWRDCSIDFDPETRIMDLENVKIDDDFVIIAACSDAAIQIFNLNTEKRKLNPVQEIRYHKTCILKTHVFQFIDKTALVTCTTRGEVAFWEVGKLPEVLSCEPMFSVQTNKSGINGADVNVIDDTRFILATAGDDNAIHIKVIQVENNHFNSMKVVNSWSSEKYHCSQITGLKIIEDLMISTSIDQRLTLFTLSVTDDGVECDFHSQYYSDVSDIHGLDVLDVSTESITISVFGKGIEVLQIPKPTK